MIKKVRRRLSVRMFRDGLGEFERMSANRRENTKVVVEKKLNLKLDGAKCVGGSGKSRLHTHA